MTYSSNQHHHCFLFLSGWGLIFRGRFYRPGPLHLSLKYLFLVYMAFSPVSDPSVFSQTLDQAVADRLSNNCEGLGLTPGSGFTTGGRLPGFLVPGQLGPNLSEICAPGQDNLTLRSPTATNGGTSTGGGAAGVQTSAASVLNLNRALAYRLTQVHGEGQRTPGDPSIAFRIGSLGIALPSSFGVSGLSDSLSSGNEVTSGAFDLGSTSRWNGFGVFASGIVEALNKDQTIFIDGYDSTILGFTSGADFRFSPQGLAGLAFTYRNTNGDLDHTGDFSFNSYEVTLFGEYLPTNETFIQVIGGYTRDNYLVARNVGVAFGPGVPSDPNCQLCGTNPSGGVTATGTSSSNSSGDTFNAGFLVGYDHQIRGGTLGPRVGLNYRNTHVHDYEEDGNTGLELEYDDQWVHSLQSVLGIQGAMAVSTAIGVIMPQFMANYIHEFANSQRKVQVQFVEDLGPNPTKFSFQTDRPVRNYFDLGAGISAILPNGLQPFVTFNVLVGNELFNNYGGTFGLRVEL